MERILAHRMAALGFAVSAAFVPNQLEGSFVPRWAVIAIGVPLLCQIDPRRLSGPMLVVLATILGFCALSLNRSPWAIVGVGDMIFILMLSMVFVAGAALETLDDLMIGIGLGFITSSILAMTQYSGIWSPFPSSGPASGLFFNSEILGETAGLIATWSLVRFASAPRVITGVIYISAMIALLCSHSRIGFFIVGVGVLVAWRPRWYLMVPLVTAVGVCASYALIFMKLGDSMHRVTLWGATIMAFTPLGNGLGWASAAFPFEEFCHSDALQALTELGVGGATLAFIPIAAFRGKRGNRAERALFAAICVEVFVSFPLHFPASGFLAAITAGYLCGLGAAVRSVPSQVRRADQPRGAGRPDAGRADVGRSGIGGGLVSVRSIYARLTRRGAAAVAGIA